MMTSVVPNFEAADFAAHEWNIVPEFQLVVLLVEPQPLEDSKRQIHAVTVKTTEATPRMQNVKRT